MGYYEKAETYLKRAHSINPSDIMTLQNMGQLYLEREQYSMALSYYQNLSKEDPNNPRAYLGIGISYKELGKLKEAQKALRRVLALDPESSVATRAKKKLLQIRTGSIETEEESRENTYTTPQGLP